MRDRKARQMQKTHEDVCAQRWIASKDASEDLKISVADLHKMVRNGGGVIIIALAGALYRIITHGG